VTSRAADVWIRAVGGELFSAGAIIMLRCRDSEAEAVLAGGACLRLVGPGCPPEYHHQLLAELARARRIYDDRWIVILSPKLTADSCRWTCSATDERSTSGALDVT
jgi:hypothetical protein